MDLPSEHAMFLVVRKLSFNYRSVVLKTLPEAVSVTLPRKRQPLLRAVAVADLDRPHANH